VAFTQWLEFEECPAIGETTFIVGAIEDYEFV
jgi:hypothetical protein